MTVDKKISYEVQGGAKNYLGKQKQVTAPLKWKSSPDSPETELAYITKAEKDLLVKKDLHGSLKGDVNRGPSGIMSLDGYVSFDDPSDTSRDTGMSGAATSAAESGRNTSDTLAEGATYQDVQDYRDAFIAAGGGQRVNPGFFDSRNVVSPDELARARAYNPAAFKAGRRGGIMDFFTGGGFLGNIVRGLGQKFGLGKRFDESTYDMSRFSGLPLGGSAAFENLDIRDKFDRNKIPVVIDNDMSLVPGGITKLRRNTDDDYLGPNLNEGIFMDYQELDESEIGSKPKLGGTILTDEFPSSTILNTSQDQADDDFYKGAMASSDIAPQFQNLVTRTGGLQDPVTTKLNEQKSKIEAIQKSDAFEYLSNAQKEQLQKDLNKIIQDLNFKQLASSIDT